MNIDSLTYQEIKQAVILPLERENTGVFAKKKPVKEAIENLFGNQIKFKHYVEPNQFIEQTGIFAGILHDHYGHFILNSLSRLWIVRQFPDLPLLWICATSKENQYQWMGANQLNVWQTEILSILNITNPHVFIETPTQIEKLILPEYGSITGQFLHPEYIHFLESFQSSKVTPDKHCWLSRSKLDKDVKGLIQESYLEDKLKHLGWEIFHPQQHSVKEQLSYLSSCEKVAGPKGSAFYFSLLIRDLKSKLHLVNARNYQYKDFEILAKAKKNISISEHSLHQNSKRFSTPVSDFTDVLCPNFNALLNELDIPISNTNKITQELSIISKTINFINQQSSIASYLEIGVKEGFHFFNIQAQHKTGIMPYPSLDYRELDSEHLDIFEISPEDYFLHFYDNKKFDLICLNNAKHLDSLFKEFSLTLSCSHENTIWLVNGSLPRDLYCTLPNIENNFNLRKKMTGVEDWSWNGQVYQFIMALHDFFPMMSYFTMSEWNNHQTIIWFEPRHHFKPRFNNFETIAKATYTDYLAHQDLYNIIPLDQAYAKLTELAQREHQPISLLQ